MTKQDIWVLYSTFGNREEALSAARSLVEKRLAACANLHDNVTSVYRWEGKIEEAREVVMTAKTSKKKLAQAMDEIKRLNSYDLPCMVAYPVTEGFAPFMKWV